MVRGFAGSATAIAMMLALSGCGSKSSDDAAADTSGSSGSEQTASAAVSDPCSYLTADQISAITTDKMTSAENTGDNTCTYKGEGNGDVGMTVKVAPTDGEHEMMIAHKVGDLLGGMGDAAAQSVGNVGKDAQAIMNEGKGVAAPKLGDESMWGMNTMLSVRKGKAFVQVTPPIIHDPKTHPGIPLVQEAEKKAIAQKVVEAILPKLPG